jgi:hypothetical protein
MNQNEAVTEATKRNNHLSKIMKATHRYRAEPKADGTWKVRLGLINEGK